MKAILLIENYKHIFTAIWSNTKKHSCFHKDRCTYFPDKQVYPIKNPCNFLMMWNVIGKFTYSASDNLPANQTAISKIVKRNCKLN